MDISIYLYIHFLIRHCLCVHSSKLGFVFLSWCWLLPWSVLTDLVPGSSLWSEWAEYTAWLLRSSNGRLWYFLLDPLTNRRPSLEGSRSLDHYPIPLTRLSVLSSPKFVSPTRVSRIQVTLQACYQPQHLELQIPGSGSQAQLSSHSLSFQLVFRFNIYTHTYYQIVSQFNRKIYEVQKNTPILYKIFCKLFPIFVPNPWAYFTKTNLKKAGHIIYICTIYKRMHYVCWTLCMYVLC